MASKGKVLTVAYGTFSCTLEGFDDPFAAMAEIAAYFRDLAAQDRHFGAKPPAPDMATLRRLAEGGTRQPVVVERDAGGVALRAAPVARPVASDDGAAADGPPGPGLGRQPSRESVASRLARMRRVLDPDAETPDADAILPGAGLAQAFADGQGAHAASKGSPPGSRLRKADAVDDDGWVGNPSWRVGIDRIDYRDVVLASPVGARSDGSDAGGPGALQDGPTDERPRAVGEAKPEPSTGDPKVGLPDRAAGTHIGDAPHDRLATPEPDVERLFAATDSRLTGADATRRHASISHLRAAIAAGREGGAIGPLRTDPAGDYRDDLARTVGAARPERPPPLVLVSAQRIERVPSAVPVFADFADAVGAVGLADVIEAAAVFCARVLREPDFARGRLMALAAEAEGEVGLEEGLRAFGLILRRGTVRRVAAGRYGLGVASPYVARADELRAG